MTFTTRDKLLDQAEALFAERGFYGVSIHQVASRLGMTRQGLLHYFPSKEKLYAEVLRGAAAILMDDLEARLDGLDDPMERLLAALDAAPVTDPRMVRVSRLLTRELLDNPGRAERSQAWFLKPYLARLESLVREAQSQGKMRDVAPLAFVYQLIGANQYFLISQPTLQAIHGQQGLAEHRLQHDRELRRTILASRMAKGH